MSRSDCLARMRPISRSFWENDRLGLSLDMGIIFLLFRVSLKVLVRGTCILACVGGNFDTIEVLLHPKQMRMGDQEADEDNLFSLLICILYSKGLR